MNPGAPAENRITLRKLLVVALLMFGFGWALIPMYKKICEATGINILTGRDPQAVEAARNTQVDAGRTITVELDANRQGPWRFQPVVNHVAVHPGEMVTVEYELVNLESRPMTGQAIPSYAPGISAEHFHKIQCFCFTQQSLAAGEKRRFPVVFFVDSDLPRDVDDITLSYTFFEIPGAAARPAVAPAAAPPPG